MIKLPEQAERLYTEARRQYRKGNYADAAALLDECIKIAPHAPDLLFKYGQIEYAQGRLEDALAYFENVRELQAAYPNINIHCARVLFDQNRLEAASTRIEEHLERHPDHSAGQRLKIQILNRKSSELSRLSPRKPNKPRASLNIFISIIYALMLRELRIRFNKNAIGYAWIILEPALQISILWIVYAVLRVKHPLYETSLVTFLVMGVMPWFLFRNTIRECMSSIEDNMALFDYRQVRPFDTVISAWLLENIIFFITYSFFACILSWANVSIPMNDPLRWLAALFLLAVLSLGLGLIASVACKLNGEWKRIIKPALRFMHFVSGVYFTIAMLPEPIQTYLSFNPLLQVIDLLKAAAYSSYISPASWTYTSLWAFGSLATGMILYKLNLRKMLKS